jgi:hypothetical protein
MAAIDEEITRIITHLEVFLTAIETALSTLRGSAAVCLVSRRCEDPTLPVAGNERRKQHSVTARYISCAIPTSTSLENLGEDQTTLIVRIKELGDKDLCHLSQARISMAELGPLDANVRVGPGMRLRCHPPRSPARFS